MRSEGAIVGLASLALVGALGGVVAWQAYGPATAPPPAVVQPDEPAADLLEGLRAERDEALARARLAEAARDEAEAARIEAVAAVEVERERFERERLALATEVEQLLDAVGDVEAPETEGTGRTEAVSPAPIAVGRGQNEVTSRALNAARVVDVNEALGYVVLDIGAAQGVKAGMPFTVLDGDEVIAQLRTSDVEDRVTGAAVERVVGSRYPRANDRAILTRHAD